MNKMAKVESKSVDEFRDVESCQVIMKMLPNGNRSVKR